MCWLVLVGFMLLVGGLYNCWFDLLSFMIEVCFVVKFDVVCYFVCVNSIDKWIVLSIYVNVGIVICGKVYFDLMEVLCCFDLMVVDFDVVGVWIYKVGLLYLFEMMWFEIFVDGLVEVLVIEEKGLVIE